MVDAETRATQQQIRDAYQNSHTELTPYEEANRRAPILSPVADGPTAEQLRQRVPSIDIPVTDVIDHIDWRMFLLFWGFKGETLQQLLVNPEAERTLAEGRQRLTESIAADSIRLQVLASVETAHRQGNDIVLHDGTLLPMLRQQTGRYSCMADYLDPQQEQPVTLFTIVASPREPASDDDVRLMNHALCARLAEAGAEWLDRQLYGGHRALRVAFGYAACPDHSLKRIVVDRLQAVEKLGITLTDHYSLLPSTAICGFFVSHPEARYFSVGRIDQAQLADYCHRRNITTEEGEQLLSKYIK